jgi:hypothetical protein
VVLPAASLTSINMPQTGSFTLLTLHSWLDTEFSVAGQAPGLCEVNHKQNGPHFRVEMRAVFTLAIRSRRIHSSVFLPLATA